MITRKKILTEYPDFHIEELLVNSVRMWLVSHKPSRLKSWTDKVNTLATVQQMIQRFEEDRDNERCWNKDLSKLAKE